MSSPTLASTDALVVSRPVAAARRARRSAWRRGRRVVLGGGTIALVVVVWHLYSGSSEHKEFLASSPAEVARAAGAIIRERGSWTEDMRASAQGLCLGVLASTVVGVSAGVALGWSAPLRDMFEPAIAALKSIPGVALIPLLMVWFGFGLEYKIAVVVLVSFFPLLVNTVTGVRNADPQLLRMARSFGASQRALVWNVALPGALPFIVTGLRQAVTHGLVGIVIAELYASSSGIGFLVAEASARFQVDRVLALVIIVGIAGTAVNEALARLEARLAAWAPGVSR